MDERLDLESLLRLCERLCCRLGLSAVSRRKLLKAWRVRPVPQPLVLDAPHGRAWLDRYYAATQEGFGKVEYWYIDLRHLHEEWLSYAKQKPDAPRLPPEISAQFQTAFRSMRLLGQRYWLHPSLSASLNHYPSFSPYLDLSGSDELRATPKNQRNRAAISTATPNF